MKNQSPEVQKENTNYMQVGGMTACGHCQPEKFQAVMPCECICHKDKQLIFETREEAREYWVKNIEDQSLNHPNCPFCKHHFTQWLSEENVTIKEEELKMGNLPQMGSIQRLSELKQ